MRSFEFIENLIEYADNESPDILMMKSEETKLESQKFFSLSFQPGSFLTRLFEFIKLAIRPGMWKVLKIKLMNPQLSSREISARCDVNYKGVQKRLNEALDVIPNFKSIAGLRI